MLTLVVYTGYVIQLYVVIQMLWPQITKRVFKNPDEKPQRVKHSKRTVLFFEYVFRTLLVILSSKSREWKRFRIRFRKLIPQILVAMAICVPNLTQIIPLVGVTFGMLLAFVFPAVIDTLTFLPLCVEEAKVTGRKWKIYRKIFANSFLVLIGVFGLVAGLESNLSSIIHSSGDDTHISNSSSSH